MILKCLYCSEEVSVEPAAAEPTMVRDIFRITCPNEDPRHPRRLVRVVRRRLPLRGAHRPAGELRNEVRRLPRGAGAAAVARAIGRRWPKVQPRRTPGA